MSTPTVPQDGRSPSANSGVPLELTGAAQALPEGAGLARHDDAALPPPSVDGGPPPPGNDYRPPTIRTPLLRLPYIDWSRYRVHLIAIVVSLLISILLVPQVRYFFRTTQTRAEPGHLPFAEQIAKSEYALYDRRFTSRGLVLPKCFEQIAIVGIDDNSMGRLGVWPFPRQLHARLINRLHKAGAKVIAFDIDFSSKQMLDSDRALAKAMTDAGNVLLISDFRLDTGTSGQTNDSSVIQFVTPLGENPDPTGPYSNFPGFDLQTPDLALAHVPLDPDDHVRRYPLRSVVNDQNVGSLAALSAAVFQGVIKDGELKEYETRLKAGAWVDQQQRRQRLPLMTKYVDPQSRPGTPTVETTLINFWGSAGTFRTYPYADVVGSDSGSFNDAQMRQHFNGRIVLIGGTSAILKDNFATPAIASPTGIISTQTPGVEIHATALAMLLDGVYLRTAPQSATLAVLFGFGLLSSLWTLILNKPVDAVSRGLQQQWGHLWQKLLPNSTFRIRIHRFVWFVLYIALGSLPLVALWYGTQWYFTHQHLWIVTVYPALGGAISAVLVLMLLFSIESVELRKTMSTFSRMVAPDVLDEMLADPDGNFRGTSRMHVTVMFTDLEGFTTYSENHEPEEVVDALNEYMERMVPIITAHGGSVDKYIGDAIMVFFGAPLPRFDHASQALHCAIAMQDECKRFREETGIDFYMRVGLHTGDVIVGCMGSSGRVDYTVIGDTVNLASRLEGKNKDFGSWIMCSRATYEAAPDVAEVETILAQIKGKSQEVEVLIVRGLKGAPNYDKHWGKQLGAGKADSLPSAERDGDQAAPEMPALPQPVHALPPAKLDAAPSDTESPAVADS